MIPECAGNAELPEGMQVNVTYDMCMWAVPDARRCTPKRRQPEASENLKKWKSIVYGWFSAWGFKTHAELAASSESNLTTAGTVENAPNQGEASPPSAPVILSSRPKVSVRGPGNRGYRRKGTAQMLG
jgi:hypothetical protein